MERIREKCVRKKLKKTFTNARVQPHHVLVPKEETRLYTKPKIDADQIASGVQTRLVLSSSTIVCKWTI